jgi:hypothetical protein
VNTDCSDADEAHGQPRSNNVAFDSVDSHAKLYGRRRGGRSQMDTCMHERYSS